MTFKGNLNTVRDSDYNMQLCTCSFDKAVLVLIQVMHLLGSIILIGSSMDFFLEKGWERTIFFFYFLRTSLWV